LPRHVLWICPVRPVFTQHLPSYPVVCCCLSPVAGFSVDKQSRRFSWQEAELDLMQVVNLAL